ncbi:MAG: hypothetical protein ASARMPRED_002927 [Alectoria sarmentosa]|nr:MAG: hypothetical protein ASARMPRED_002927 [Alectoria sarmentosa]
MATSEPATRHIALILKHATVLLGVTLHVSLCVVRVIIIAVVGDSNGSDIVGNAETSVYLDSIVDAISDVGTLKWKGGIAGNIGGLRIGCARAIDIAVGVGNVIGAIVAEVVERIDTATDIGIRTELSILNDMMWQANVTIWGKPAPRLPTGDEARVLHGLAGTVVCGQTVDAVAAMTMECIGGSEVVGPTGAVNAPRPWSHGLDFSERLRDVQVETMFRGKGSFTAKMQAHLKYLPICFPSANHLTAPCD